ncbi:MAG: diguanylate cyclase [Proteobacteria bacterium]|nr:diguanylate cyclase [Pseudomonadota bacterium]
MLNASENKTPEEEDIYPELEIPKTESIFNEKDIRDELISNQIEILHNNFFPTIVASLICGTIIFISLIQPYASPLIWIWYVAVIVVSIFRLALLPLYLHRPQHKKMHLYLFILGTSLAALLWGVAGSILIPHHDLKAQMVIIVVLAGISAGGVQTLNAHLAASLFFLILIIVPLCVWLIMRPGSEYVMLSIAIGLYLIFMIVSSYRSNRLFTHSQQLFYQNKSLLKDLSLKHINLIRTNKSLKIREQEMLTINEMNQVLQLCQNSSEAYTIICQAAQKLFIQVDGGLAILNKNTDKLHVAGDWDWNEEHLLSEEFFPTDCWALRSGNVHVVEDPKKNLICHHFKSAPTGKYLCIPLIVQSEVLGMLNFNVPAGSTIDSYHEKMMIAFSGAIKLGISNIRLHEALKEQATHDPLTGLFNRRYLNEILPRELQRVLRNSSTLCIAILDLDHFKNFNDTCGHKAGDAVLKLVADLLKENFRGSDIVCRFGGEEFIVILGDADTESALIRLNEFSATLKKKKIYYEGNSLPSITISVGVAEAPKHSINPEELIKLADVALYAAKNEGRDRVIAAS